MQGLNVCSWLLSGRCQWVFQQSLPKQCHMHQYCWLFHLWMSTGIFRQSLWNGLALQSDKNYLLSLSLFLFFFVLFCISFSPDACNGLRYKVNASLFRMFTSFSVLIQRWCMVLMAVICFEGTVLSILKLFCSFQLCILLRVVWLVTQWTTSIIHFSKILIFLEMFSTFGNSIWQTSTSVLAVLVRSTRRVRIKLTPTRVDVH